MRSGFIFESSLLGRLIRCPGLCLRLGFVFFFLTPIARAQFSDRITHLVSDDSKFGLGGFRVGKFIALPRLSVAAIYDDNILHSSEDEEGDLVGIVSPGISVGAGSYLLRGDNYVRLDYAPSFLFFAKNPDLNSIDHLATLDIGLKLRKTTLALNQVVDFSASTVTEVDRRIESRNYSTELRVQHPLGGKTDWEFIGQQSIADYDELIGRRDWLGQNFLTYEYTLKVRLGLGLGVGYREVEDAPAQLYEHFLLRAEYELSDKTRLFASAGGEWVQYGDGGGNDFGPVFALRANWQPKDFTTISLSAHRRNQPSAALKGQNYTTTGFTLAARQRFLRKMFFNLSIGFDHRQYTAVAEAAESGREDDYMFLRLDWNWFVRPSWNLGTFYLHRRNSSTDVPFSNNVLGLQTTFTR